MIKYFNSFLLREKFTIYDPDKVKGDHKGGTIALSNRLAIPLKDSSGTMAELYIVRSHNMHSAVRMTARVIQAYNTSGKIAGRVLPFDWESAWDSIVNDYEHTYNPDRWVAIYSEGKCIFGKGERHPFLDLIEKCDFESTKEYDYAVPMAEKLLLQNGKKLKVEHNSNVALSLHFEGGQGRLGIIQRGPDKTTTFTFTASPKKGKVLNLPQCLSAAAAFLEGVQLCFLVGMNTVKIRFGKIERFSKEDKQTKEARKRVTRLMGEIGNLENEADIRYRPEKPDFQNMIMDAEEVATKIIMAQMAEEEARAEAEAKRLAEEAEKAAEAEAENAAADSAQA